MIEIKSCVTPSPEQWDAVIKGMRLPMKSTSKYDSIICDDFEQIEEPCFQNCPYVDHWEDEEPYSIPICARFPEEEPVFVLGKEDKRLALGLAKISTSERKYLRQLPLILTVRAPLYWWKQADQYKISTTTNSESTMHTLIKEPFEYENFSWDYESARTFINTENIRLDTGLGDPDEKISLDYVFGIYVNNLNSLRNAYEKTEDMRYWKLLNQMLPQSYMQTRCWSINYETALNVMEQRRGHKNKEWDVLIDYLLENVPYLKELYEASQYKKERMKELEEQVKELEEKIKQLEGTK